MTQQSRADAVIAANLDRARRPEYYKALRRAKQIDRYDVRNAIQRWTTWAEHAGIEADAEHCFIGRRCVATLDGATYHAGVIVAVELHSSGLGWLPHPVAYWGWLLAVPPGWVLYQPFLKFDCERVKLVRRKHDAE